MEDKVKTIIQTDIYRGKKVNNVNNNFKKSGMWEFVVQRKEQR